MEEVVYKLEITEKNLHNFLRTSGPVLTIEERIMLADIIKNASDTRLNSNGEGDPVAHQAAESMCNKIEDFERRLTKRVRDQVSL